MSARNPLGLVWQKLASLLASTLRALAASSKTPSSPSSGLSTSSATSGRSEDFEVAVRFVLRWETVYCDGVAVAENDPKDPGGLTKYGIDQRSNPGVDIASLTEEQAVELYWREWLDCKADCLKWPLSLAHFDAAVNTGPTQAAKFLQQAVGAAPDGIIGPITLKAASAANAQSAALACCLERERFYVRLAEQRPRFQKFLRGWMRRVKDLRNRIYDLGEHV